jgi:hypothetical protein
MRADRQLGVGRKDHQAALVGKIGFGIEAQQRMEHRQRSVLKREHILRLADIPENLPLVDRFIGVALGCFQLPFHQRKRHRSPPKGRRHISSPHFPSPLFRQKKSAHQNGAKDS